jgi:hypothetical protein
MRDLVEPSLSSPFNRMYQVYQINPESYIVKALNLRRQLTFRLRAISKLHMSPLGRIDHAD